MKLPKTRKYPLPPTDVRRYYERVMPSGSFLAVRVLFALRASMQDLENRLVAWQGSDAVTAGRLQVLMVLLTSNQPIPQREIVRVLQVSRATVSDLVEVLRVDGHVTTAQGVEDKRQVLVMLTPTGRRMTARLARDNADRLRIEFAMLNDDELRILADLLGRLLPVSE